MKLLLEAKSPLNATDADGSTALHHAVCEGHGEAALMLLRAGAETDKRDRDEHLAIDLTPDTMVSLVSFFLLATLGVGARAPESKSRLKIDTN